MKKFLLVSLLTIALLVPSACKTVNVFQPSTSAQNKYILELPKDKVTLENDEVIFRFDSVDFYAKRDLQDTVKYMINHDMKRLTLKMFNGGGNIFIMLAMYEIIIEAKKHGIYIAAHGETVIGSAAVPLFLLADYRTLQSTGYVMMHPAQGINYAPEHIQKLEKQWIKFYVKIVSRNTRMFPKDIRAIIAHEDRDSATWINAKLALELGFIHEIKTIL
jgi:ATP-dependent protease ClpP protease subunit